MLIRCADPVAAVRARRFSRLRLQALRIACTCVFALVATPADAADITWIGGNANWNENTGNASWNPADEPDFDDTAIFNTANVVNLGSNNAIFALTMSGSIDLNTNNFNLNVNGLVQLTGASTNLFVGGIDSLLTADSIAINNGANLELNGGIILINEEAGNGLLDINAGGELIGHGTLNMTDAVAANTTLIVNDGAITARRAPLVLFGAPQIGTLTLGATDVDTRIDLDGVGEVGIVTVSRNQTLNVSVALADAFNGDLKLGHNSTLRHDNGWQMAGGTLDVNNGFVDGIAPNPDIPADKAFLGNFTQTGGTITVIDTDGTLQFNGVYNANGGSLVNNGLVVFNENANIGAAANFTMPTNTSSITVESGTVNIDDANFNADGNDTATNVITVNGGGVLDLDLGAGADELLDGSIVLAGGELDVTTASNEWRITRSVTVNPGLTTSRIAGETVKIVGAELTVGAGATLTFDNRAEFLLMNQVQGSGQLRFNNEASFASGTTLDMTGGTVDLDGTDTSGESISVLGTLTINAATMASFGRVNNTGGASMLSINSSFGSGALTVNLDDANGAWTLNAPGVMDLINDSSEATLLAGSDVNVNGTVNVIGDVRTTARLDIGSTAQVNINTAGEPLRLSGGDTTDVNTIAGATVAGAGLLGADTGKALHGFGTINTGIDFDGTSNLRADNGTLTINGAILDAGQVGTADADGTLQVTNAWNNNVTTGVQLNGGTLSGGAITNDVVAGISGHGLVEARVINNTQLFASIGDTLIFQTAGNNNDWDGTINTGEIEAVSANIELRDVGAAFGFTGTVRATNSHTAFANGFALDFNPGSTLALASGGKYRSSSSTDIGGTVTVGAGGATIEVQNNSFLTFETGSTTTLNGNLQLLNNNINIEQGATFTGTGALIVPDGSHMVIDNQGDVDVLLDMQGALRPGNFNGIGRIELFDYQSTTTSELFVELIGTSLNQFDRLVLNGDAVIDGYLNIDIDEVSPGVPFVPVLGNTFNIITGNSVTGEFDFADVSGMPDGLAFAVEYLSNAVQLQVVNKPFFSADFDNDGDVDGTDFAIWDGAYDLNQLGDADGDNDTDGADLILWQQQFGSRPGGPPANAVPEPTSLLLLLIACLTLPIAFWRRRGRIRIRLSTVSTILSFALAHTAAAQTVNLSLNLEYNDPADLPDGGAWTLVAKTDSAHGISLINAILSNIDATGITAQEGIGAFLNGGSPIVGTFGTTIQVVYLQDLSTPANVVMNVGRGAGTPGNIAVDFLNDPQWTNSAKIFSGTFGNSTPALIPPAFTTHGSNVTQANVLRTGVPPFTFALPASVTTIVRNNLGVLGDIWDNTSGSGLWSDAANWADNSEPTAASNVTFPVGFPNGDTVITLSAAETAAALTLHDNYTLSGGSLTLPASASISVAAGKTATITSPLNAGTWTKSGEGTLAVPNVRADALTVGAGAVLIAPNGGDAGTSVVDSLTLNGSSKLDLNNNDLIIRATAVSKDAEHANIEARIVSAQNGVDPNFITNWSGPGISSAFARTANVMTGFDLVALGVIRNSDIDIITGLPGASYTSFSGQPVTPDDVLVKYTYIGDGNLDGLVSFDDYVGIDNAFFGLIPNLGWATGDINFDGVINFDDYTVVDQAFFFQGALLSNTNVAAVPEPGTSILAALAACSALTFSRKRRSLAG